MRLLSPLYDRVMAWSRHRHAPRYLGRLSFAGVFPGPLRLGHAHGSQHDVGWDGEEGGLLRQYVDRTGWVMVLLVLVLLHY